MPKQLVAVWKERKKKGGMKLKWKWRKVKKINYLEQTSEQIIDENNQGSKVR